LIAFIGVVGRHSHAPLWEGAACDQ
jgi:hypothetical protein